MTHPSTRNPFSGRALRIGALGALLGLSLVSCSDGVTGPSDLTGSVWRLQEMRIAGATSSFVPADPSRYTVEFREDGVIHVQADCNGCGGRYSLSGRRLSVDDLACTLMGCVDGNGGEFANLIAGTATLDKDGPNTLEISSANGRLTLTR